MAAESIEHLGGRRGDVHGEGVIFHPAAGRGKHPHGGVRPGRGSVPAGGCYAVFQVQHPLFGNADEGAGLADAGEHILHHGAALIHHQLDIDMMLPEPVNNVDSAPPVDLLLPGKGKVDILRRGKAGGNQVVGGTKHAVEGDLGIQRAAPPQHPVLQNARKGRFFPVFLLDGHHIVVRHHDGGFLVGLARPVKQQGAVRQTGEGAELKHMGVELRQQPDELFKFRRVLLCGVGIADGAAAHQLLQTTDGGFPVKFHRLAGGGGFRLGPEGRGAQQHDRQQQNKDGKNEIQYDHGEIPSLQDPLFIQDARHPDGKQHADRHHDADGAGIQGGHKDKQHQHQADGGDGKLGVLGDEHHPQAAE